MLAILSNFSLTKDKVINTKPKFVNFFLKISLFCNKRTINFVLPKQLRRGKNIEQMKTFKTISNIVKENDLHRLEADCYGLLVFKTNNESHPEMDGSKYKGHITRCGKKQGNFLGVRCHNTGTMIAPMQKVHFNFKVKDIKRFEIEI